jgi:DNA segregation ATPase FtsK/SpoIIIE, S-DNA-T family
VTLATTTGPDDDRAAEVERLVLDAELVDRPRAGRPTAPPPPIRRAAQVARRQAVHAITTVATHDRTKTTAKATGRHLWFPIAGAGVAVKRWRDAHGANRYERMMRAAEVAGDREQLLEWEARDVAEKQRRHDRVMDWVRSPLLLAKAIGIGVASVAVLLLGLGVILALAEGNTSRVLGPIVGVIEAVRWTAWFLAAYGVLLLLGGTAGGIAYLWHLGRTRATVPAWIASPTADVRSVVKGGCRAGCRRRRATARAGTRSSSCRPVSPSRWSTTASRCSPTTSCASPSRCGRSSHASCPACSTCGWLIRVF